MTQVNQDPEDIIEQEESVIEAPKKIIPPQKVSRFGPVGFQAGSRFGKGPTGSNPQLKQRPGRAAARGR